MNAFTAPAQQVRDRYVFVDALRGIAAIAVVICHLFHHRWLFTSTGAGAFGLIADLASYGARGVQIFFVISGFVIAHSLRRTQPAVSGIGNFILRRQVRLDLPYWAALAGLLLLGGIERLMPFIRHPAFIPSPGDLLLNMSYLHMIFQQKAVLGVAWTLCIEIQFYLFFVLLLALTSRRAMAERVPRGTFAAVFVTGILALACNPGPGMVRPWMVHYWPYFAAGALTYWSVRRQIPLWVCPAFCLPFTISWLWSDLPSCPLTGVVTAAALYGIGLTGKLTKFSGGRGIQYVGGISYSLYLVHGPVIFLTCQIGFQLTHDTRASAALWYSVAGIGSVITAHFFSRCVEQPSMKLAAHLKRKLRPEKTAAWLETPSLRTPATALRA